MIFFNVLIIITLVIILIYLPSNRDTWKVGRMSCNMLVVKDKQFHCIWEGRASICNRHECPMMKEV